LISTVVRERLSSPAHFPQAGISGVETSWHFSA